MSKKIILNISPQTFVRATVNDRVFFRIPRELLRPPGLKRLLRLERYNNYKISLLAEAKRLKFTLPEQGAHVIFYVPVPKSWRKHKKKSNHLMLHTSTPDLDNLTKAFLDSLMAQDKHICDLHITKRWINSDKGYIEVLISNPTYASKDNLV